MGIELPAELADVATATGLSWPQADEDKLRQQAGAWRDAQGKLTALAGEADHSASAAVGALTGPSADAASKKWAGFVHPDNGHLTTSASGAGAAADRLDHAADQVGQAKVEMVRQLVNAAKNTDAAHAAAAAGHPTALLGLDTALRGTATNLSSLAHGLADAVGPGGAGPVSAVTNVVDANPGAHTHQGQGGLLSTVTGLPPDAVSTVDSTLGNGSAPEHGGQLPGGQANTPLADTPVAAPAAPPVAVPPLARPVPSFVDSPDAGTGPIQVPVHQGGFVQSGGFDNARTPPTGTPRFPGGTVASGFTDPSYSPSVPAPAAAPLPVASPAAQPGYLAPPQYSSPAPPPVGAAPPAPPAAGFAPRQPLAPGPVAGPVPAGGGVAPARPVMPQAVGNRQPAGSSPYAPQPYPAQPRRPAEAAGPQSGVPRQERESIVALFLVHMFPLGHLPVAADRPARQLPVPPPEVDYAPGLRFPPHDHPRSDLFDPSDALGRAAAGHSRLPTPAGEPAAALRDGHDPLGGLHERDWDRRFLAGMRGDIPEYAWPPGELHPEGGHEPGEPELIEEGTLLDRFGPVAGRVFAPAGTSFAQRSLPPAALESGYRRYRVLRETPMWQAVSAPWFGQPGGGLRYRAVYAADELVTMGFLEDVTFEEA